MILKRQQIKKIIKGKKEFRNDNEDKNDSTPTASWCNWKKSGINLQYQWQSRNRMPKQCQKDEESCDSENDVSFKKHKFCNLGND